MHSSTPNAKRRYGDGAERNRHYLARLVLSLHLEISDISNEIEYFLLGGKDWVQFVMKPFQCFFRSLSSAFYCGDHVTLCREVANPLLKEHST